MWTVNLSNNARKNTKQLPVAVEAIFKALLAELEAAGPFRHNWPNYSKLGANVYHCHIKKGRPTYVAVWTINDRTIKILEVLYVGTHEKAPY
jgi:mRNA-degrading endonuclease RelE of RelBE toxin-antitoxin system